MNCTQNNESFTELKNDIEVIANKYFKCLKSLSKPIKNKKPHSTYIKKVKEAYAKLDCLDQRIINNEFFYQDYPDWWKKSFSKTTFYRIKKKSMVNFLEAFSSVS